MEIIRVLPPEAYKKRKRTGLHILQAKRKKKADAFKSWIKRYHPGKE